MNATWKALERQVAKFFNTSTNRSRGQGVQSEDVLVTPTDCPYLGQDYLVIEVKYRQSAALRIIRIFEKHRGHPTLLMLCTAADVPIILGEMQDFPRLHDPEVSWLDWQIIQSDILCPEEVHAWILEAISYRNTRYHDLDRAFPMVFFRGKIRSKRVYWAMELPEFTKTGGCR